MLAVLHNDPCIILSLCGSILGEKKVVEAFLTYSLSLPRSLSYSPSPNRQVNSTLAIHRYSPCICEASVTLHITKCENQVPPAEVDGLDQYREVRSRPGNSHRSSVVEVS